MRALCSQRKGASGLTKKGSKRKSGDRTLRRIEYYFVLGNYFSCYFHYRSLESTTQFNFILIHGTSDQRSILFSM